MIQKSFLGSRNKKLLLRCRETWVQSWQPLRVGALLQKLWFQEEAKWVINATDSWKWGDEKHFRTFKCGRSDYSNQNAIPFCYSLPWTARLRKKKPKKAPCDPKLCSMHKCSSPDRELHRQLTQKATWYLSCFVLSTKTIPAASRGVSCCLVVWILHRFATEDSPVSHLVHDQWNSKVTFVPRPQFGLSWPWASSLCAPSGWRQDISKDHCINLCTFPTKCKTNP